LQSIPDSITAFTTDVMEKAIGPARRLTGLPLSPESVLAALEEKG